MLWLNIFILHPSVTRIFRGPIGFVFFPIVTFAKRLPYFDGQQNGSGLVKQRGRPWHSVRGQSCCKPLRFVQSQFAINIPPLNSRLLHLFTYIIYKYTTIYILIY